MNGSSPAVVTDQYVLIRYDNVNELIDHGRSAEDDPTMTKAAAATTTLEESMIVAVGEMMLMMGRVIDER